VKKLAVGCLIVLVLLAIGGGIAGYWLYSKARSYVRQFEAVAALDKNVTNTTPFTAPPSGELTDDMVKRFVAVQESMNSRLGQRVGELKAKQDEFQRRQETEHRQASATEVFSVVTGMMGLILEAKNAQVDALNQAGFSLDEYYWVRGQVYGAAGLSLAELSLKNLPDAVRQGGGLTKQIGEPGAVVPPKNKELVAPHLAKLRDWAPLAFFGL
jgi:hypothetical protein